MGDLYVRVSCDTTGNILFGMHTLKNFDVHISNSLISGNPTFICCAKDNINQDYEKALADHFKLYTASAAERRLAGKMDELKEYFRGDIEVEIIKQQNRSIIDSAMKEF